jgi:hypothetical protein
VWFYKDGTSIAQNNNVSDVSIFSNNHTIYLDMKGIRLENAGLTITNILGQTISTKQITSNQHSTYNAELPSGFYIVKVSNNGKSYTKKVYLAN